MKLYGCRRNNLHRTFKEINFINNIHDTITEQTIAWIKSVVIGCNFCPFAAKALNDKTIRYIVINDGSAENILQALQEECIYLDDNDSAETSFIIFSESFDCFTDYLDLVDDAEQLIIKEDHEGIYQIASFHPKYCFAGSDESDAANYTNRSPFPMLQILREDSVTKVLKHFPNPENIPENNIAFARQKGLQYMQLLRAACME